MRITPLDLGAWITVYCGLSLLRSSMPPYRRDSIRFGSRRKRAFVGYVLLILGAAVLLAALLRHL